MDPKKKRTDKTVRSARSVKKDPQTMGPIEVLYIPTYLPVVLGSTSGRILRGFSFTTPRTLPYLSK